MGLPEGAAGVRETLKIMSALVKAGKKNPAVRLKAVALTQGLRQKDRLGEIRALTEWVRDHIRYVRDITNVETVHTAEQILSQEAGDCDDKSVLLAAMLESIGHPTAFMAIGTKAPGKFSHVLPMTRVGERGWMALETTEPVEFGWQPKNVVARMYHFN